MPEQLPADQYALGGQPTITGYVVVRADFGFEEDSEDKQGSGGRHKAKITYSRRKTANVELEALGTATTQADYVKGGAVAANYTPGGTAAWKIRNVTFGTTRGVQTVMLDLISLTDEIA